MMVAVKQMLKFTFKLYILILKSWISSINIEARCLSNLFLNIFSDKDHISSQKCIHILQHPECEISLTLLFFSLL